ncbi:hypothetical protein [Bacilliculturomica massiliensis]|uniref:hypothetical protein n=1 Tax=Bacilliculturomica massiliensis TaxID=1917867 RepID=UPI00103051A3|nr:hypothetical protein [Bacilliculturomica massiliensis]
MKKLIHRGYSLVLILLLLSAVAAAALTGCGDAMGDEETPEITIAYLEGAYAQQLMNDGAEKLLGSIELNKNESDEIEMILHPKEIVEDSSAPDGYRIDSFALNRTFTIPEQAYTTYLSPDGDGEPQILTPADFYTAVTSDYEKSGADFSEYGNHILYDVYALENQTLLILAHHTSYE